MSDVRFRRFESPPITAPKCKIFVVFNPRFVIFVKSMKRAGKWRVPLSVRPLNLDKNKRQELVPQCNTFFLSVVAIIKLPDAFSSAL